MGAETMEAQEKVDAEWLAAGIADRCLACQHVIVRHTARVGEGIRICASCPCDRYAHYS